MHDIAYFFTWQEIHLEGVQISCQKTDTFGYVMSKILQLFTTQAMLPQASGMNLIDERTVSMGQYELFPQHR